MESELKATVLFSTKLWYVSEMYANKKK